MLLPLDFAAKKKRKRNTKTCDKGYNCGNSCINRKHKCRAKFSDQASTYAGWLKKQAQKTTTAKAPATVTANPPVKKAKKRIPPSPAKVAKDFFKDNPDSETPKSDKGQSKEAIANAKEYKDAIDNLDVDKLTELAEGLFEVTGGGDDSPDDRELKEMFRRVGFDKTPTVLSKAQMDKEAGKKGAMETYRGVRGKTQEQSDQFSEDFKSGDYFAGLGIFGNGTYMAYKQDDLGGLKPVVDAEHAKGIGTAYQYAGMRGTIMRSVIPKDYKLATEAQYQEAEKTKIMLETKFKQAMKGKTKAEQATLKRASLLWSDTGKVMTAQGYDGFVASEKQGFVVALNRSKLLVQKDNHIATRREF